MGKLSESAFFLYIIQDFIIALTFTLIFREISKLKEISDIYKALLFLLTVGHSFWHGLIYYEFHELSFAPLGMLGLIKGYHNKMPAMFIMSGIYLMLLKETAFFTVGWTGLLVFIFGTHSSVRRAGGLIFCAALGFYWLYFRIMLPQIRESSESMFLGYYQHLGSNMVEVILSPLLAPKEFFSSLLKTSNLFYCFLLFGPVIPYLRLRHIWPIAFVLPDLAIAVLSNYDGTRNPYNQYAGITIVPIIYAAILGATELKEFSPVQKRVLSASTIFFAFFNVSTNPLRQWNEFFFMKDRGLSSRPFVKTLRALPKDVPVVVSDVRALPFVAQRDNLIWMPPSRFNNEVLVPNTNVVFSEQNKLEVSDFCELTEEWKNFSICKVKH